jgi:ureidoacrylate peracid hydrolase
MRQMLNTLEEKVDPRWAAVIVVDMQNDFVSPGGAWDQTGEDITFAQQALPRIIDLVAGARKVGVPIVFIRSIYTTDDNRYLSDVFLHQEQRKQNAVGRFLSVPVCKEGTWGWEIAAGLEPLPQDTIVTKHRYSAFHNTDLDLRLRSQGIRTAVVAGVGSAVCVESTVRHGYFLDYYQVIVSDCCAGYSLEVHQQAVRRMDYQYGEAATCDRVLAAWTPAGRGWAASPEPADALAVASSARALPR